MGQLVSDVSNVLDYKKTKKSESTARQQVLAQMAEDEKTKTNLVKKALATQRAKYGASGMSNRGMTENAVLERLKSEAEQPYTEKRRTNLEKLKTIKKSTKPNLIKTILSRFDDIVG